MYYIYREKFNNELNILNELIDSGTQIIISEDFDCIKYVLIKYIYPDCKEQKEYNEEFLYFLLSKGIKLSDFGIYYSINLCIRNRHLKILEELLKYIDTESQNFTLFGK